MSNALPWLLSALLFAAAIGLRAAPAQRHVDHQTYEDLYYLPRADALPWLSLGYDAALADLIWMRAQVYIGDEFSHRSGVEHVFQYADAILALDPDFKRLYRWIGTTGIYRPRASTEEEVERALGYLERGFQRFPSDGQIAWEYAATLLYDYLPRIDDEEKREEIERRAAFPLEAAARLGGGPAWLAITSASTWQSLGETERAIAHLEQVYPMVDEETQTEILARLTELRGASAAEGMAREARAFTEQRLEQYPYLTHDEFVLIGPRPAIDLDQNLAHWWQNSP